jgi:YVTN family beta-propeller protein
MEFRILGPLEVVDEDRTLSLGSGKQLALVAVLLLHRNEAVSVDRLVDELWDQSPPPTAAKIVRNYVSLLRRELDDRLVTRPPGYLLRVEDGELDSARLERAVADGDLEELTVALGLWRGPPLSQFTYEPFAQSEITRLDALRLAAVEKRIDAELGLGRHASVIPELEALVQQHPLREHLYGLLMLALYRSGRQADALETYRRARLALDQELGIEPGPALRELERGILNQDESLEAPAPPERDAEPPPARRRSVLLIAAALVVALVTVYGFLVLRDASSGLPGIPPNYVGAIEPSGGEIVAAIPVGVRPGPVAYGAGSLWVGNLGDRNLTRIDPVLHTATETVSIDNATPTGLAVGDGAVWVAHGLTGDLSRIESTFTELTHSLDVADTPHGSPTGSVAIGAGYVWAVFGDSTLARIDPGPVRLVGTALAGFTPSAVVVSPEGVWVANSGGASVDLFDPTTFEEGPLRPVTVGRRPSALAFGEGSIWVANRGDDTVTRIDPPAGSAITIEVGDEPAAVTVGAGAVWVANAGDRTVSRIDPAENEVDRTIDVESVPAGIAFGAGLVWVTAQAP